MTTTRVLALSAGLGAAFLLGVWTGPAITSDRTQVADVALPGVADEARPSATRSRTTAATEVQSKVSAVPASEPDLHKRLKPVLAAHTDVASAAAGFRDGEQFAAVAHAARNTGVPFQLLKHNVLEEKMTLVQAIRALQPDADAAVEAERARVMARGDVASIAG